MLGLMLNTSNTSKDQQDFGAIKQLLVKKETYFTLKEKHRSHDLC